MQRALAKVAQRQWGVFSRAQALAAGVRPRTVHRRVGDGSWQAFDHGVYRYPGGFDCWHQKMMAATLALGPRAMASHRAAAFLWGIELRGGPPLVRDVTAPRNVRRRTAWARVHWTARVPAAVAREGIPTTPLARTLLDLGDVLNDEELIIAVDSARRKFPGVVALLEHALGHEAAGRRTAHRLAAIVARFKAWRPTDSALEGRVAARLAGSTLPRPVSQHVVTTRAGKFIGRVDFAWVKARVILECDSSAWHLNPVAWNRDLDRRRRLEAENWRVVHVTDAMVDTDDWLEDLARMIGGL